MKITPAKTFKAREIRNTQSIEAVDLIVPFHGRYEAVSRFLQSLWHHSTNYRNKLAITEGIFFNVCLVDDGSPNHVFLKEIQTQNIPGLTFVQHETRRGFGASVNSGIKATQNPWIVIMHSDVMIDDARWLRSLCDTYFALKDKNVKMVGSSLENIRSGDPRCQRTKDMTGTDIILENTSLSTIIDEDRYLSLTGVLCHRELFRRVGFLKEYPIAFYEDLEFACRMFRHGYRQAICGKSHLRHDGGLTINAICELENQARKTIDENLDRCYADIAALV